MPPDRAGIDRNPGGDMTLNQRSTRIGVEPDCAGTAHAPRVGQSARPAGRAVCDSEFGEEES